MKGVILAAGKGSRLYPVTYIIPKPLLPLVNRPTLEYAFDRIKEVGIKEVCLVVGENEQLMKDALGDGSQFGLSLSYVKQENPHGLAHAVGFAKDFVGDDSFMLYLGDAIYSESLEPHARKFLESGCANLNLVKPVEDPRRYGVANTVGDKIVKLVEKPKEPESNLAMAGTYFFSPELWQVLPRLQPSARGEYEITDAIQMMIDEGKEVLAGVYKGDWFDSGTLDSFLEVSAYLSKGESVSQGTVSGEVRRQVVVGKDATLQCSWIEDAVILPGAKVLTNGHIRHAIIGGTVTSDASIEGVILHGDYKG